MERDDTNGWTRVIGKRNKHLKNQSTIRENHSQYHNGHNIGTYYFTEFPTNWDHVVMKEVFSKYGKVEDVFIARKRNKQGKRFGFSRFIGVSNPTDFERLLNSICIGTHKISCNIARFQRRSNQGHGFQHHHNHTTIPRPPPPHVPPISTSARSVSFADKVKGIPNPTKTKHKQTTLNIKLTSPPLLNHPTSVIAELKSINGAINTHNLILDEGFDDFYIKYIGGLYLLIQLPNHNLVSKVLSNPNFLSHFKTLIPWNNNFRITNRVTWIAISGLPPQLWSSNSFSDVAGHWGKVIIPEDCNVRQFNRSTGKVCILTNRLDIIQETATIPVDNEHIVVRVYEIDEDIDSLFNGYHCESSSDDDDDDKSVDDGRENNLNTSDEEDEHIDSDDESTQSRKDDEGNDDYQHVEDCNGKREADDFLGEDSSVGANSKNMSDINPNMVRASGFNDSGKYAGTHIEEGSMSATGHGVNDTNKNNPMTDRDSPYVKDNVIGDTEVKSTHFCDNSDPTFVQSKPNSLTGPLNYGNHISSSKAHMAQSSKPMPNRLTSSRSPTKSRNKTNPSSTTRRSLSVPINTLSQNNRFTTRKKHFISLKLIHPFNGVRGFVTQPRKSRGRSKTISQSVQATSTSADNVAISDSLSKIQRCNHRIISNPNNVPDSDSNEVSNTIHVGNKIGFHMNGKEQELEGIFANGDCNYNQ
jgi:hypothetical protein